MNESKMLLSMFLSFLIFIGFSHEMIFDLVTTKSLKTLAIILVMIVLCVMICVLLYNF